MAINLVQMQRGMSLVEFLDRYGTTAQCETALIALRWPSGSCCPGCGSGQSSQHRRGDLLLWQCSACRRQTSLTAGTPFEHTHLKLTTWFLAIYLWSQSKTQMAALALRRQLGISWKAAWLLKHKLMEAMFQREQGIPLQGVVSIDDAYLGGERTGGKAGRGSENKVPFVAAIAPRGKAGTEIEPFRWLNTILGNLKTAFSGTHHAFAFQKYGHRYLADAQYRFNRRADLSTLPTRLIFALALAKPCPAWKIQSPAEVET